MLKTKSMPWLPWWPPVDGGEVKQTKKFSVVAVALLLGLAGCGTTPKLEGADWTAIGFVDGSEKLELWFRLPSWFSPSPDGLRSGCGTRAPN